MRLGAAAINLIWLVHQVSPALADPRGHIQRRNAAFGHMFKFRDGNDAEEDGPDGMESEDPDEASAIGHVIASRLSDLYKANVTAGLEKIHPLLGSDPMVMAKICLPDGCFASEYASGHTELQAGVDAWALLAYKVKPFC